MQGLFYCHGQEYPENETGCREFSTDGYLGRRSFQGSTCDAITERFTLDNLQMMSMLVVKSHHMGFRSQIQAIGDLACGATQGGMDPF